jgi:hypothetical protein
LYAKSAIICSPASMPKELVYINSKHPDLFPGLL